MINFTFYKDSQDNIKGFIVKGHSGYAESGKDIICAAVSSLVINTINSIDNYTEDRFEAKVEDGYTKFMFISESVSSESVLLMKSLLLGITEISTDNKKFISTIFKEV